MWPWGNEFDLNIGGVTSHANIGSDDLLPVDCFPTGVSSYGVYNIAGNVQEWVADWYAEDYYARSPKNNPKGSLTGCRSRFERWVMEISKESSGFECTSKVSDS
jgi:formylglycine-generating enzyme required for sulfatase activity